MVLQHWKHAAGRVKPDDARAGASTGANVKSKVRMRTTEAPSHLPITLAPRVLMPDSHFQLMHVSTSWSLPMYAQSYLTVTLT